MSSDGGQVAREEISRAELAAAEAVRQAPDGTAGFKLAVSLAEAFHAAGDRIARLRGQAQRRIRDEKSLSLRALADETGMSKSRVQQLMQEADDE
jgi:hypothetical protein